MKKIPTLLPKNPEDLSQVINGNININVTHFSKKIDGTSCMIKDGKPYCRYDAKLFKKKKGKIVKTYKPDEIQLPEGSIPCQEPDEKSGHWPHWIPVSETNPEQKYIYEGFQNLKEKIDGTYECIGPKIQNNPHHEDQHYWIPHFSEKLITKVENWKENPYEFFKTFFENFPWEGLVAYKGENPVAKIRRSDFGFNKIEYENTKDFHI